MKKILGKQPLVYSLISVETTKIPGLEDNLSRLHTELAGLKFSDGPLQTATREVSVGFADNAESGDVAARLSDPIKRWDFLNLERSRGVVVSENIISLKQTDYTKFEDMLEVFRDVLGCFERTIKNFDSIGIRRIGLRYIDALLPMETDEIVDYVDEKYRTALLAGVDEVSPGSEVSRISSRVQTEFGHLQHSYIENFPINGRISLLPPEFHEPPAVALHPVIQEHWGKLGAKKYALLDIDHFSHYQPSIPFDSGVLLARIKDLYKVTSSVFWGALSEKALEAYGYEEIEI